MKTVYKVYVQAINETSYSTNACKFATVKLARSYGEDLLSRWFGASKFIVIRVDERNIPNRIDKRTAELVKESI